MNNLLDFSLLAFASLFVIVDPIGAVPAFVAMTARNSVAERLRMSVTASLVSFLVLIFCQIGGPRLFAVFGVTFPALEIAGGIVLLLVGIDMLRARRTAVKETEEEEAEGIEKEDVAVTPLAVPMLAGPGAIATVMLLASKAHTLAHKFVLAGNIAAVFVLTFLILQTVSRHTNLISTIALKIVTRLLGLLLTAIAVQFLINGLKEARLI